ncbi:MAG: hypothetical protein M1829_001131 [Trizodia sp. TS-e1964]|nr:MAG: hypothetical protein M1829_001131 [Trizodia sp. TS-e1964]
MDSIPETRRIKYLLKTMHSDTYTELTKTGKVSDSRRELINQALCLEETPLPGHRRRKATTKEGKDLFTPDPVIHAITIENGNCHHRNKGPHKIADCRVKQAGRPDYYKGTGPVNVAAVYSSSQHYQAAHMIQEVQL